MHHHLKKSRIFSSFLSLVYKPTQEYVQTLLNKLINNNTIKNINYLEMMNKKITDIRIQKEVQSIEKQPIPSVILRREGYLNFHFCFYGLEEQYKSGLYHGILELPQDYPFSPPKIKFITNNGRFQVNKFICTSFTHYHKETWSSSWNIRTILTAMISFMYCDQRGIGAVFQTSNERKRLAAKSLQQNLKNQHFATLFKDKLVQLKLVTDQQVSDIFRKIEKAKHRKRARSQTTHADQIRDCFQLPYQVEMQAKIDQKGENGIIEQQLLIKNDKNEDLQEIKEIADLELLKKKRKRDQNEESLQGTKPKDQEKYMVKSNYD